MRASPRTLQHFALHMLASTVAVAGAFIVLDAVYIFAPFVSAIGSGGDVTEEVTEAARRVVELHETYWPVAASSLLAVAGATYFVYRRMVSPFPRIHRRLAELAEGRLDAVVGLRATDYLHHEVDLLNAATQAISCRMKQMRNLHSALDETLFDVLERARELQDERLLDQLAQLVQDSKALGAELERGAPSVPMVPPVSGEPHREKS